MRKNKNNFTRGEAVKRWLTEAQITDHYKDEDVAMDVMNASPSRPNPAAPNSAKAKQYHVTVMDDQVKGTETGDETGIAGHGELDAEHCKDGKFKQMLDMLGQTGDASSSSGGVGAPVMSEEERLRIEQEAAESRGTCNEAA